MSLTRRLPGSPRLRPRFHGYLRGFMVAALVVAVAAVVSASAASPAARRPLIAATAGGTVTGPGGVRLIVPAGALSHDAAVSITEAMDRSRRPPDLPAGDDSLRPPLRITIGNATLVKPITIQLPLDPDKTADQLVYAAVYDEPTRQWVPLADSIDESGGMLNAELEHLSWVGAFSAGAAVRAALLAGLRVQGSRADPPTCGGGTEPIGVRREPLPDDFNDPLLACIASDGDGARVTLVNNRGYPLVIPVAAAATLVEPPHLGPTDTIIRAAAPLPGGSVYLPAREKATFAISEPLPGEFGFTAVMTRFTFVATLMAKVLDTLLEKVAEKYIKNAGLMGKQLEAVLGGGMKCLLGQIELGKPATTAADIWTMIKECSGSVIKAAELTNPKFGKLAKAEKLVLLTDVSLYLGQADIDALLNAGAGKVRYVRDYPDLGAADIAGDYRFTFHPHTCDGFADTCPDQPSRGRVSNCTGSQCSYTNLDGGFGTVTLSRTGRVWRATGVLRTNAEHAITCYGQPRPTSFEFTVTVLSGQFANNVWTAAKVQIDESDTAEAASADCPAARLSVTATADRSR